ncbi:50S ribosomal protein L19 [Candidatus Nasuia deltocephalinicola]|uniref:50S ribosomal protein L19 n=1 Tax=Candidatus Nasuia deltocephalincola TaxID=1160784 RepID=UPI00216ADAFD|nr:50S ribosomal protein L19 [Candidatus Nasuia deltocephalinicola]
MSLLNIINKKIINKNFSIGDWIYLKKKQNIFDKKIIDFDGLIIYIKKKNMNPIITIVKKINNIIIKRVFLINSPLIINYRLIKNKKNKKLKNYSNF